MISTTQPAVQLANSHWLFVTPPFLFVPQFKLTLRSLSLFLTLSLSRSLCSALNSVLAIIAGTINHLSYQIRYVCRPHPLPSLSLSLTLTLTLSLIYSLSSSYLLCCTTQSYSQTWSPSLILNSFSELALWRALQNLFCNFKSWSKSLLRKLL